MPLDLCDHLALQGTQEKRDQILVKIRLILHLLCTQFTDCPTEPCCWTSSQTALRLPEVNKQAEEEEALGHVDWLVCKAGAGHPLGPRSPFPNPNSFFFFQKTELATEPWSVAPY